ncbi:fimbrial protein [Escherichia coli]|uniref:fimbrial protein n=1 Tax=Escherichia coli TaxID=562 RepID=UPI001C402F7B|nr:fimbrial protein [Escherichia coli]
MKGKLSSVKLFLLLTGGLFYYGMKFSLADTTNVNIDITGTVYIPPCKINGNDEDVKVYFDKIPLYEVDGYKNAKTKTVTVSCDYYQGTPYIRMEGAMLSGAGDNVLKTTGANSSTLGIALYQGRSVNIAYPLKLGAGEQGKYGYKIMQGLTGQNTASEQFTFTAVLGKYGTGVLKAGAFSAVATMSISYL